MTDADDNALIDAVLARGKPGEPLVVKVSLQKRADGKWWAVMSIGGLEAFERGPFLNRDTAERARRKLNREIAQSGIAQHARE